MQSDSPTRRGFTLPELAIAIFIVTIIVVILFPIFARPRYRRTLSCASNQKQIGLAFLQYIQDYDEKFPPAVGYAKVRGADGKECLETVSWAVDRKAKDGTTLPGLLQPYVKSRDLFLDPIVRKRKGDLYVMYNDLMAEQPQSKLADVSKTILTCEGEELAVNAGHAYESYDGPFDAEPDSKGKINAGKGATVRTAVFRHDEGANFAFSDGHVKWFKMVEDPKTKALSPIYFPPRSRPNPSSKSVPGAPQPGKAMGNYQGTFHLW